MNVTEQSVTRSYYTPGATSRGGGGGTPIIFSWGCAAGTLRTLAYTRAYLQPYSRVSTENPYPILDLYVNGTT